MNFKNRPTNDLSDEIESLREEIAHLQSLILRPVSLAMPSEIMEKPSLPVQTPFPPDLFEDGPFGMALIDAEFRIVNINSALCRMLGRDKRATESLNIHDIALKPETLAGNIRQLLDGVSRDYRTEEQLVNSSNEPVWVCLTLSDVSRQVGGGSCCLMMVEEIGARKYSEQELLTEKQLLEWLINSSVDGIVAFDLGGFFTVWNSGMERIFGVSARETLGRPIFQACPFLKEIGEDKYFAAALRGEKSVSRGKYYLNPGTVNPVYFEGYYGPLRNPRDGTVIGGLAIIRDVTERIMAEEGKRASEDRYRELFENAYDIVFTHDLAGNFTSINKAAERILEYPREEALKMRFSQFVAPEFRPQVLKLIDRLISEEIPMTQELDVITRSGGRITLEAGTRLIYREGKPYEIQGIARDVSERKKTEEALHAANIKLESWVHELEQRTREMTLLSEMGDILRACLAAEEVYEVIVRISRELFPAQGGALFVMGPLRNMLESVAGWGDTPAVEPTFRPEDCWSLRRGRTHYVRDTRVGLLCKHIRDPLPRGYLCVPMVAQSEAVGVLHLASADESPIPEAKQRLAMAMAERVAMALSNLKMHETLRNQSIRDHLTGLFNRSFMEESLELELRRAARAQSKLSVLMLSLDDFQRISETYGIEAGDIVICDAGQLLQKNVRKGDIACRYSGHTYIIILPQTGREVGKSRATTFCNLLRMLEVTDKNNRVVAFTASAGLAMFP
ncbi:MAG TPA: PAS domain S-box protein, partial [Acidobacteriota bacterium]|nr:PAS domain S-box protein [Acidobacteriota bacterium]